MGNATIGCHWHCLGWVGFSQRSWARHGRKKVWLGAQECHSMSIFHAQTTPKKECHCHSFHHHNNNGMNECLTLSGILGNALLNECGVKGGGTGEWGNVPTCLGPSHLHHPPITCLTWECSTWAGVWPVLWGLGPTSNNGSHTQLAGGRFWAGSLGWAQQWGLGRVGAGVMVRSVGLGRSHNVTGDLGSGKWAGIQRHKEDMGRARGFLFRGQRFPAGVRGLRLVGMLAAVLRQGSKSGVQIRGKNHPTVNKGALLP